MSAAPTTDAPPVPRAARPSRMAARVDAVLIGLVLAFAFLAASFAARNSDLWLHLAAGRLIAQGSYTFGADPFSYTTAGVYWANHAWLFDLIVFGVYRVLGGVGLVVLKAIGVAALAGVMLRTTCRGGPTWVAAGCVLLAVLAMSPRLLLQPACLSLLMLGVSLYLLRTGGRAVYTLPGVVVLWVNLDAWFVLGPLLVGLFWVGRRITADDTDGPRLSAWLLPACVLACLLSPHHVHGLTLPPELSLAVWRSGFPADPRFAPLFASPWQLAALGWTEGLNLAAWAYVLLLALGGVSFLVNRRAAIGWRGSVWLGFALLGAWQARLVPFFAVVAGPITALNFQDLAAVRRSGRDGRGLVLAVGLALLVLAWPGWLQSFRSRDRVVSWEVIPDPSLERAAQTIARWRREGILPAGSRVFGTHPDVSHHLAWFCPCERVFIDSRLSLHTGTVGNFIEVSRALGLTPGPADLLRAEGILRANNIGCLVLYDPDPRRFGAGLREVRRHPDRWELLRVDGSAVIITWAEAGAHRPMVTRFDPEALAFGPESDDLPPAPASGPPRLARPAAWWDPVSARAGRGTWETAAAGTYLSLFEEALRSTPRTPDAPGPSPALPLLAIRAARSAVAANPDDAVAWVRLAGAYRRLSGATWEGGPGTPPPLAYVRHVQAAAALAQAVALDPALAPAHDELAELFAYRGCLDLALDHRAAQLRIVRRVGPFADEPREAYTARVALMAEEVDRLEAIVQDAENRFLIRTDTLAGDPLRRARIAVQLGLAGKARDVLLRSHPDLYGRDGVRMLLDLLLTTGLIDEAGELLDGEVLRSDPMSLGYFDGLARVPHADRMWRYPMPAYEWFALCRAAAAGRYDQAGVSAARLRDQVQREEATVAPALTAEFARQFAIEAGLAAPPNVVLFRLPADQARVRAGELLLYARFLIAERADLHTLAGVLLLERGAVESAVEQFTAAVELAVQIRAVSPAIPVNPLAGRYLEAIRKCRK